MNQAIHRHYEYPRNLIYDITHVLSKTKIELLDPEEHEEEIFSEILCTGEISDEQKKGLNYALDHLLSGKYREVLRLRYENRMWCKDVASELGIAKPTVDSMIKYAIKSLSYPATRKYISMGYDYMVHHIDPGHSISYLSIPSKAYIAFHSRNPDMTIQELVDMIENDMRSFFEYRCMGIENVHSVFHVLHKEGLLSKSEKYYQEEYELYRQRKRPDAKRKMSE
jgi:hypothetical protein